jgi:hypothetical protein
MAKKTTTPRAKSAPKGEGDAVATPAAKPRARARTAKAIANASDTIVVTETLEVTEVVLVPTDDDIRIRAYHRYLERGGSHGMDFEDWLEAERELRQRK